MIQFFLTITMMILPSFLAGAIFGATLYAVINKPSN
jgi:hypothetical protein